MADADLQSLRLFLTVYELKNLTHAAHQHNTSPPSVTKRIRELEERYKVTLFERKSRGMVPTAAGDELARSLKDIFGRLDHIHGTMTEFSEGVRGSVRVHASASVLLEALIGSIVSFRAAYPFIRIELNELMSWAIVRDVAEGRADVGLVAGTLEIPADLTVIPYREDRLVAMVPLDHDVSSKTAVTFEELLDYEHIGIGVTSAIAVQLAEEAQRLQRNVHYSFRVASYDVARRMVAAGCGLSVVPTSIAVSFAELVGFNCIPLTDEWAVRPMRICIRDEATLTVAARSFVAHLRSSSKTELAPSPTSSAVARST